MQVRIVKKNAQISVISKQKDGFLLKDNRALSKENARNIRAAGSHKMMRLSGHGAHAGMQARLRNKTDMRNLKSGHNTLVFK